MEQEKQPLSAVIQSVIDANNPYSGTMYTKEDVLRILNMVTTTNFDSETIEKLKRSVRRSITDCNSSELIDYDSMCFEIRNGNEIEATDGEINFDALTDSTDDAIDVFFENLNN